LIKKTFSDISAELDLILSSKRSFWNLSALSHIDYDDISQEIRLHIHSQFGMWDQSLPFGPWAAAVVNNQISNLKEKYYGRFAPPCRKCKYDLGENRCEFTSCGQKTDECQKLRDWRAGKEASYRLILAESTDTCVKNDHHYEQKVKIAAESNPDYEKAGDRLHELVMKGLNPISQKIYRLLFIEGKTDKEVSDEMGYRTSENGKKPGYRRISGMKKILIKRAKKIMRDHDVFTD
jgi:DNA-directed RNA polymerase specialized sigma24 family protein